MILHAGGARDCRSTPPPGPPNARARAGAVLQKATRRQNTINILPQNTIHFSGNFRNFSMDLLRGPPHQKLPKGTSHTPSWKKKKGKGVPLVPAQRLSFELLKGKHNHPNNAAKQCAVGRIMPAAAAAAPPRALGDSLTPAADRRSAQTLRGSSDDANSSAPRAFLGVPSTAQQHDHHVQAIQPPPQPPL